LKEGRVREKKKGNWKSAGRVGRVSRQWKQIEERETVWGHFLMDATSKMKKKTKNRKKGRYYFSD